MKPATSERASRGGVAGRASCGTTYRVYAESAILVTPPAQVPSALVATEGIMHGDGSQVRDVNLATEHSVGELLAANPAPQLTVHGVGSATLELPCRYTHPHAQKLQMA